MTKRIFRSICLAALTILAASIVFIMAVLYEYFTGMQKNQLKSELALAVNGVENSGISYLEQLDIENIRLTWIDSTGKVLFDSKSNSADMENHFEREEVREAFESESGTGESERYSATLTEKTFYYAQRLDDGTVLRSSISQASVPLLLLGVLQPIVVVFIIALVISFVMASKLSKSIVEPLNRLDLDAPLSNDTYDEISPLLSKIARQQKKISRQMDELNQRKSEFIAITSNMNEGLVLLGRDRKIISINPSAESFFSADIDCVGRDFIEVERNLEIVRAIENVENSSADEVQIERGGRTYQLNISCIKELDEPTGFVILIFDITEKLTAESRRKEFTANVSHELKSPLHSIMGSAELIENGIVKKEDIPKFISNIRTESARLVTMIEDIIRLSQLDEGTDLPSQEFDLYGLAAECIERLKPSAEKKNVRVKLNGSKTEINSVRPLVSEIIYNLVDNAIKYNIDGGVVDVSVYSYKITVSDTGIGIPKEHQSRIFERFYCVDKSHSRETGGTGLGLAIVKHAAEEIGADISLESEAGKGTVITLLFRK